MLCLKPCVLAQQTLEGSNLGGGAVRPPVSVCAGIALQGFGSRRSCWKPPQE